MCIAKFKSKAFRLKSDMYNKEFRFCIAKNIACVCFKPVRFFYFAMVCNTCEIELVLEQKVYTINLPPFSLQIIQCTYTITNTIKVCFPIKT